jgi:hypothetical protein
MLSAQCHGYYLINARELGGLTLKCETDVESVRVESFHILGRRPGQNSACSNRHLATLSEVRARRMAYLRWACEHYLQ